MHGSMSHNYNANNQVSNNTGDKNANKQNCYLKLYKKKKLKEKNKLIKILLDFVVFSLFTTISLLLHSHMHDESFHDTSYNDGL